MTPTERARLSLAGLAMGDAFGSRFFGPARAIQARLDSRELPPPPWRWSDDTAMASSVVEVLEQHARIDPDALARAFARRWREEPGRGYGRGVRDTLDALAEGEDWRTVAPRAFGGEGSCGNGGAMRAAPVGAWFADDLQALVCEADLSAAVTHSHADGRAGAVAVAAAAAWAWLSRADPARVAGRDLLGFAWEHTPAGPTREGLAAARALPVERPVDEAARVLGSGIKILSRDTVPFALWVAQRNLHDVAQALWDAVAGLGDTDTVCAIAGGIVVLRAGWESVPAAWRAAREPLPLPSHAGA